MLVPVALRPLCPLGADCLHRKSIMLPCAVEVFCGRAERSSSFKEEGFDIFQAANHPHDMSLLDATDALLDVLWTRHPTFLWLVPPCGTFSTRVMFPCQSATRVYLISETSNNGTGTYKLIRLYTEAALRQCVIRVQVGVSLKVFHVFEDSEYATG